jgi:hypothetical protein
VRLPEGRKSAGPAVTTRREVRSKHTVSGEATRERARPSSADRLAVPGALLSRGDLAELGLGRAQVDAIFRRCPVVAFPGTRKPLIRVADYLELLEASTYRGDRVRPT